MEVSQIKSGGEYLDKVKVCVYEGFNIGKNFDIFQEGSCGWSLMIE